jgi:secondary thiamine-phosphate synthase enzyme
MKQFTRVLQVPTRGKGLYNFTREVETWLHSLSVSSGVLTVFIQHTSASLTIQENADPDVVLDLNDFFSRLVPEDNRLYRHTSEGPDDMPAHIRSALTQVNLSVPMIDGELALGIWQGLYVFEHRATATRRRVALHFLGE